MKIGERRMMRDTLATTVVEETSQPYIGRWHRLVSTTNWEKGRIIHEWRSALIAARAPAVEHSDEAWARTVGGVSGQHVGRLRRVYDRFGQVSDQFEGLFWSHFQSAVDWDDAEMWLEGAVQNGWSVSVMRQQRWQTLGAIQDHGLSGENDDDEDVASGFEGDDSEPASSSPVAMDASKNLDVEYSDARSPAGPDFGDDEGFAEPRGSAGLEPRDFEDPNVADVRPFENLPELPDDLLEEFESMKLAILRHKTGNWQQVSPGSVLANLDALKTLVIAM
jgi:hypothetical protein